MDRNKRFSIDPIDLLNEHYESVNMSDDYRRSLRIITRGVVAARPKKPVVRWAISLVGAAMVIALLMVIFHQPQSMQKPNPAAGRNCSADAGRTSAPPKKSVLLPKTAGKRLAVHPGPGAKPDVLAPIAHLPRLNAGAQQQAARKAPTPGAPESKLPQEPVVAVVSIQQPVTDGQGHALKAGDRLPAGVPVRTGATGRVTLVTAKGSEVHLAPNSELVFSARNVALITRGRMFCANREKEIARIDTPAGQVELLGTVVDTAVVGRDSVAVTVVEGKVQLSNLHGIALVDAGNRSVLVAFRAPQPGKPVNARRETAWYQGRGEYQSDFGDIAYIVRRGDGLASEVWTMKTDGSGRHRVKSYIGSVMETGQWLPGEQWLALQTYSVLWTTPDMEKRTANAGAGHPIADTRTWLLNAVTGQEMPIQLPDGYDPLYISYSPNAKFMAFCGSYSSEPGNWDKAEGGVWVYDTSTANMTKVFDGWIKTPVAWAPDSHRLAVSSGQDYTNEHSLMIVDTQTRKVQELKVKGAGASFSPDGTRLAYCGDFRRSGSWFAGVPMSGSIFVLNIVSGGEPVRVSPPKDDVIQPRWSPDGSRIAYIASLERVCVVRSDGTEVNDIYTSDGDTVSKVSWAPKGNAIYVSVNNYRTRESKTLLVAADGSGIIRTLSQSGNDSRLPSKSQKQTDAAALNIREAVFQYAMANIYAFEGDLEARRKSFATSADLFGKLVWDYPLSGLSTENTFAYADAAAREANRPDSEVLRDTCKTRMSWLGGRVSLAVATHKQFAQDLPTLLDWLSSISWQTNWLCNSDEKHVRMLGLCPGDVEKAATPYIYTPPADGLEPSTGDVLLRCPLHPDVCYAWDENSAHMITLNVIN